MKNSTIFFITWLVSTLIIAMIGYAYFTEPVDIKGKDFSFIPPLNALFNGLALVNLLTAYYYIKVKKDRIRHRKHIIIALIFTLFFLIFYLIYHFSAEPTHYAGKGWIRYVYFFILISHVVLAAINLPLVIITLSFALNGKFDTHRKWAKITFPVWTYVSFTGILVFLLNYPYY